LAALSGGPEITKCRCCPFNYWHATDILLLFFLLFCCVFIFWRKDKKESSHPKKGAKEVTTKTVGKAGWGKVFFFGRKFFPTPTDK